MKAGAVRQLREKHQNTRGNFNPIRVWGLVWDWRTAGRMYKKVDAKKDALQMSRPWGSPSPQ